MEGGFGPNYLPRPNTGPGAAARCDGGGREYSELGQPLLLKFVTLYYISAEYLRLRFPTSREAVDSEPISLLGAEAGRPRERSVALSTRRVSYVAFRVGW